MAQFVNDDVLLYPVSEIFAAVFIYDLSWEYQYQNNVSILSIITVARGLLRSITKYKLPSGLQRMYGVSQQK